MTKNFAHRGFSGRYPENTILAFRKAIESGCDGIELDVQMTRDGQLVIIHDENVDRTCNGKGFIGELKLSELRKFDAYGAFPGQFGTNRIPTLREYFDLIRHKDTLTNIELKNTICNYPGLEEKVIETVHEYHIASRVLFSSFNHCSMIKCKQLAPEIKVAFLVSSPLAEPGRYTASHGGSFLNVHHSFLTDEMIRDLKCHGVDAQAWTVNEESEMLRLAKANIYAVITNFPDRMKNVLDTIKTNRYYLYP
ncbi:MAG: glycerophosphodiester phosphodiesterase [Ruminococcaceae bacterium]|nr:glycerophosphodiester phosphodiesterase [Oscillospiraceae bacterium]